MTALVVTPLTGMPEVATGDDLALLVLGALTANGLALQDGDVLVVSSKVASKAMGLSVPSGSGDADGAREALVAAESEWVVAERRTAGRTTQVVKARSGPVMAAAGVDASNTGGLDLLLVLPHDPDAVCRDLHAALVNASGVRRLGVVLSDTAGRAWRVGQTDFALGAHGLVVADDLRGGTDADGRPLEVTSRAVADEVASAADLVKGKTYAVPVAHVRGLVASLVPDPDQGQDGAGGEGTAAGTAAGAGSLVRTGPSDWFGLGRAEAVRAALGVTPGSPEAAMVGIASALPEDVGTRVGRAVAVALMASADAGVDVGQVSASSALPTGSVTYRVIVSHHDPVELGLVVGRLLVALHGEWLHGELGARAEGSLTLEVVDRQG
ncbi:coenzyme F420-0:L-glutamate ligase [Dermatophilaceae bacterium Soc4.6]